MARLYYQTDRKELERRWEMVGQAMKEQGIDALILAQLECVFPGPAKYLTDINPPNYANFFLWSPEGFYAYGNGSSNMTTHIDGMPLSEYVMADKVLGVRHSAAAPGFAFSQNVAASAIVEDIRFRGYKKVGFCSLLTVPAAIYNYVTQTLTDVEFVEFTDTIDRLRAVKSEYEIKRNRRSCRSHDEMMEDAKQILHRGVSERYIRMELERMATEAFAAIPNIMLGYHTGPQWPEHSNEVIAEDGAVALVIECSTMGGLWSEMARTFVIGDPTEDMLKVERDGLYMEKWAMEHCKPGVVVEDMFREGQELVSSMGYIPDDRLWGHGHCIDLLERPALTMGEKMAFETNMVFSLHPAFYAKDMFVNCNDFLLTENGMENLIKFPNGYVYQNY